MINTYIATVINKSGEVSTLCCINDGVVVHSKHVTAPNALVLIAFLSHVSDDLWSKAKVAGSPSLNVTSKERETERHSTVVISPQIQQLTN